MQIVILFKKKGLLRHLSAVETSNTILRTLNRAGLDTEFSEGFHPLPKVSFLDSTPTGMIDLALYVSVKIKSLPNGGIAEVKDKIKQNLPYGLEVHRIFQSEVNLNKMVNGYEYIAFFKKEPDFSKSFTKHSGKTFIPRELMKSLEVSLKKNMFVVKYTVDRSSIFNPYLLEETYLAIRTKALVNDEDVSNILEGQ